MTYASKLMGITIYTYMNVYKVSTSILFYYIQSVKIYTYIQL